MGTFSTGGQVGRDRGRFFFFGGACGCCCCGDVVFSDFFGDVLGCHFAAFGLLLVGFDAWFAASMVRVCLYPPLYKQKPFETWAEGNLEPFQDAAKRPRVLERTATSRTLIKQRLQLVTFFPLKAAKKATPWAKTL